MNYLSYFARVIVKFKSSMGPRSQLNNVLMQDESPMTRPTQTRGAESTQQESPDPGPSTTRWTFLTNHAHVLALLDANPEMILRDVATRVGITERAVQHIVHDLVEEGFIERKRVGRQNHYRVMADRSLRHPIEAHRTIGDLLKLINK